MLPNSSLISKGPLALKLPIDPASVLMIAQQGNPVDGPSCMIHLERSHFVVEGSLEDVCSMLGFDLSRDQMLTERLVIPLKVKAHLN